MTEDKFAIDPKGKNNLIQYVAWSPEKRISDFGQNKFIHFIDVLKNMSAIVIEMIENDYFASKERVELAHVMSWMLGCTEYGMLSTKAMEIGYYDLFCDKYCSYFRQNFPKDDTKKLQKRMESAYSSKTERLLAEIFQLHVHVFPRYEGQKLARFGEILEENRENWNKLQQT